MRWVALVAGACACNATFDLAKTQLPPPDAPARCPSSLGQAPRFLTFVTQAVTQNCSLYTVSPAKQRAVAICIDNGIGFLAEGDIDGPLAAVDLVPRDADTKIFLRPRLTPEGDALFLHQKAASETIGVYQRGGDAWTWSHDLPFDATERLVGTPSRGPARHVIAFAFLTGVLQELADDGTNTWTEIMPTYSPAELAVSSFDGFPHLGPDGLRLVFAGSIDQREGVFYSDRDDISQRFRPAMRLEGAPSSNDPFLTDDCARLYFSGLQSIFYSQQL